MIDYTFGQWLRHCRTEMQMTQRQLADAIGCDQTDISRYESGAREPGLAMLRKLVRVIGDNLLDNLRT